MLIKELKETGDNKIKIVTFQGRMQEAATAANAAPKKCSH